MKTSFQRLPSIVARLIAILSHRAHHSDAFACHRNRALIHQRSLLRVTVSKNNSNLQAHQASLLINQRLRDDNDASITLFSKKDKDDDIKEKGQYTRVDDGSPIGVAIVILGSLFIYSGDETLLQSPTSSSAWIVFATASIAAGLARLFRYLRDKNE